MSPWPWARNWQQLFADPALAKTLYSNDFPLVDLTVMPDNQIARHRRMAMLELLQKHIRHRDLAELQVPLIALMTQGYLTEAQLNTLLRYMLQAGTTEHPGALIRTLAAQSPRHKELMMTIAEWLEEKAVNRDSKRVSRKPPAASPPECWRAASNVKPCRSSPGSAMKNSPRWHPEAAGAALRRPSSIRTRWWAPDRPPSRPASLR